MPNVQLYVQYKCSLFANNSVRISPNNTVPQINGEGAAVLKSSKFKNDETIANLEY